MKQNFIFASCFLRSHFLFATKKIETPCWNGCSYEKGSLGKDMPSVGMLVGSLLATTGLAACALLEPSSSASSSWHGLCRQSDWAPYWLGARALAPRVCSWSDQGWKPNSAASNTSGSSKIFFCHLWLACSNTLACLWGSLGGLLVAAQKPANLLPEGLVDFPPCQHFPMPWKKLVGILLSPVEEGLWIHNVLGYWAYHARRKRTKKRMQCDL